MNKWPAVAIVAAVLTIGAPIAGAPAEREVAFVTSDGVRVSGTVFGSGPAAVVLAHILSGDRTDWAPFARVLAADGYMVIAFDFRGHGKTSGRASGIKNLEREVLAAAAFAKGQGAQRVALIGASMGGTASVKAAASGAAAGLIAISSPMAFGALVTAADLARVTIPSLWIVGKDDADFVAPMRRMYAGVRGPKSFHTYPGDWHGTRFLDSPHAADFTRRMLLFLRRYVPAR